MARGRCVICVLWPEARLRELLNLKQGSLGNALETASHRRYGEKPSEILRRQANQPLSLNAGGRIPDPDNSDNEE